MPYTNLTTVANVDALLGEIRTFLNATGDWGIHQDLISPTSGSPDEGSAAGGRKLTVSNGDVLAGLRSTSSGAGANRLYLFDGIPSASPLGVGSYLDRLPGNSGIRATNAEYISSSTTGIRHWNNTTGPFPNAYLFSNDPSTYCHVVLEVSAGIFHHMMFGNLQKFGSWTGGAYYGMSYWDQDSNRIDSPNSDFHTIPFDNGEPGDSLCWTVHHESTASSPIIRWLSPTGGDIGGVGRLSAGANARGGFPLPFHAIPQTPFSGVVGLAPIIIMSTNLADTPDTHALIGRVPDVRVVNLTHLAVAEEYVIGADTWKVFPHRAKNGATDQDNSGVYGLAYRKLT
jgi:hypothetical protein